MQMRELCLKSAQMAADKAAGVNGVSNGAQAERTTAKVRNSPARTQLRRQKGSSSEESTDGCNGSAK